MSLLFYLIFCQLIAYLKRFITIWIVSLLMGVLVKTLALILVGGLLQGRGPLGNLIRVVKESFFFCLSFPWLKGFLIFSWFHSLVSVLNSRFPPLEEKLWFESLHGTSVVFIVLVLLLLFAILFHWFQQRFDK